MSESLRSHLVPLICETCGHRETFLVVGGGPVLVFHRKRYFNGEHWTTCSNVIVAAAVQDDQGGVKIEIVKTDAAGSEMVLAKAAEKWYRRRS